MFIAKKNSLQDHYLLWHPYKETARFFVFLKVSAYLGFKFGKMSIEFYLSVLGVFKPLIVFQFFFESVKP